MATLDKERRVVAHEIKKFERTAHEIHQMAEKLHKKMEKLHRESVAIRARARAARKKAQSRSNAAQELTAEDRSASSAALPKRPQVH